MAKTIVFPHAVIYNGVFYSANTDIKMVEANQEEHAPKTAEGKPKKRGVK